MKLKVLFSVIALAVLFTEYNGQPSCENDEMDTDEEEDAEPTQEDRNGKLKLSFIINI